MARLLDSTPKHDGFRLPGEFEAKSGCWLGWPERTDVWRNGAKPAQKVWVQIVTAISQSEPVTVCASAAQFATAPIAAASARGRDDLQRHLVSRQRPVLRGQR
jgi:agmatine deiminase